jgi:hypothetical protein
MSYELDINEIERKTYMSYHEDGLVDIAIGMVILTWGIFLVTEPSGLIGLLAPLAFAVWYLGKRFVTFPRTGMIQPSPKMEKRYRNLAIFMFVLGLVALGGILVGRTMFAFPAGYSLSILGLVLAFGVSLLAFLLNASRLYLYAILIFIAFAGGEALSTNITTFDAFAVSVILAGGLILLSGLIVLVRFLRKYPLPKLGA